MFFFQNLTAELFLLESPDDSYFPESGGSTFLKTVGSHFSEICGNKVTAYTHPESHSMVHHTTEAEHVAAILKSRAKRKATEEEASKGESK